MRTAKPVELLADELRAALLEGAAWRRQLADQCNTTEDEIKRADAAEAKLARIAALCDEAEPQWTDDEGNRYRMLPGSLGVTALRNILDDPV